MSERVKPQYYAYVYGVLRKANVDALQTAAYRSGQQDMQRRAAEVVDAYMKEAGPVWRPIGYLASAISSLPIEEPSDG